MPVRSLLEIRLDYIFLSFRVGLRCTKLRVKGNFNFIVLKSLLFQTQKREKHVEKTYACCLFTGLFWIFLKPFVLPSASVLDALWTLSSSRLDKLACRAVK